MEAAVSSEKTRLAKIDVRVSHLTFTLILEELLSGACTAKALADHSGMTHRSVLRLLRTMHAKKVVHVAGWEKDVLGRFGVAAWALGCGRDAPRITKPRQEVNRDFRARQARSALAGTAFQGLGA
jgi:hypothetical protein